MVDAVTNVCLNQELQNVHALLVSPLEVTERLALVGISLATPSYLFCTSYIVNSWLTLSEDNTQATFFLKTYYLLFIFTHNYRLFDGLRD